MDTTIAGSTQKPVSVSGMLCNVEKLYYLARDKKPESRALLTHEISSILEADVTLTEGEMVADVLIELLRQAEKDLRQSLSEKLSTLSEVPLRLILQLANDEIDIARPILKTSPVLGDMDLMYIIKSKTAEYWQAIAGRQKLSNTVIDVLAETKDFETSLTLAENTGIILTDTAMTAMSDLARDSDVLAMPLLRRAEVPKDLAAALYDYVGSEIKKFIADNYDVTIDKVSSAVEQTVREYNGNATAKDCAPEDHMVQAAKAAGEKGMLTIQGMLNTLRRGNLRSFVAQISIFTGMSADVITRIIMQKNGQGLAIMAKAYRIEKENFISMYMLTSKFWNQGQLVEPHEIKRAVAYYNRATPELAMDILKGTMQD